VVVVLVVVVDGEVTAGIGVGLVVVGGGVVVVVALRVVAGAVTAGAEVLAGSVSVSGSPPERTNNATSAPITAKDAIKAPATNRDDEFDPVATTGGGGGTTVGAAEPPLTEGEPEALRICWVQLFPSQYRSSALPSGSGYQPAGTFFSVI
jgi:hypothetical protein